MTLSLSAAKTSGHGSLRQLLAVQRPSAMTPSATASSVIGAISFTSPPNPAGCTTFISRSANPAARINDGNRLPMRSSPRPRHVGVQLHVSRKTGVVRITEMAGAVDINNRECTTGTQQCTHSGQRQRWIGQVRKQESRMDQVVHIAVGGRIQHIGSAVFDVDQTPGGRLLAASSVSSCRYRFQQQSHPEPTGPQP